MLRGFVGLCLRLLRDLRGSRFFWRVFGGGGDRPDRIARRDVERAVLICSDDIAGNHVADIAFLEDVGDAGRAGNVRSGARPLAGVGGAVLPCAGVHRRRTANGEAATDQADRRRNAVGRRGWRDRRLKLDHAARRRRMVVPDRSVRCDGDFAGGHRQIVFDAVKRQGPGSKAIAGCWGRSRS